MAGGRPLLFETVLELQSKVDAYFADCDPHPVELTRYVYHTITKTRTRKVRGKEVEVEVKVDDRTREPYPETYWGLSDQKPYTVTGLANFLDTTRRTLIDYEDRDEFSHTIKAAKGRIEHYWETQLLGPHATGPIFNLKNNYGWKDRQEVEHSGHVNKYDDMSDEELQAEIERRT